ncbi:MAG: MarR family transcriptional regulator [Corynebacterium sp.]|nr:MarR family transcriptional regulator [Corynebacterium sp.]
MTTPRSTPRDFIAEATRNWERHGWKDAAPGMATVTSVVRVGQILTTRVEAALKPFGITFSRYELLALLMFSSAGSLPMSKASDRLQVHPASVTNTVSRLEKDGLVRRSPDPRDGRGTLVSITDQGIALLTQATPELNRVFVDLGVTDESRDAMLKVCKDFRRAAGDTVE